MQSPSVQIIHIVSVNFLLAQQTKWKYETVSG